MSPVESVHFKQDRSTRLREIERVGVTKVEDEYKDEIDEYQKVLEMATIPDLAMMNLQPELEWHMRPYLLDFLIESHISLNLLPQTLFLTVNLIDRYCSRRIVFKKHYQLVGCAALWIASKYEDKKDRIPNVRELKIMCCDAYEEDMFVQMEGHVLSTLEWSIGHPTAYHFLKQQLRYNCSPTLEHLSHYLAELAMFHKSFLGFPSSVIASSASFLAQHVLSNKMSLPVCTSSAQESACVALLAQFIMHTPSQSLQKKFSSPTFSQVGLILQDYVARKNSAALSFPPTPPATSERGMPGFDSKDADEMTDARYTGFNMPDPGASYMTPPCTPDEPCLPNFAAVQAC
ncbi:cyclin-like protein [Limtongia smithiae]|uniref:cyclin-like protein n=1 Tax=Limtongia smithiae TaxID=1125753 RepID=UPI0034CF0D91